MVAAAVGVGVVVDNVVVSVVAVVGEGDGGEEEEDEGEGARIDRVQHAPPPRGLTDSCKLDYVNYYTRTVYSSKNLRKYILYLRRSWKL